MSVAPPASMHESVYVVSPVMGRESAGMAKPEVAIIFIRNTKGDFFVHQRLATKETFSNKYGLGAGGYVDEGETPTTAAQRELLEETGLETPVRHVCRLEFDDPDFQQISHLFVTESEGPIHNDEKEWQWSGWMSKAEVDDLLRENKLCTDTAAMYVRYVSELENLRGRHGNAALPDEQR